MKNFHMCLFFSFFLLLAIGCGKQSSVEGKLVYGIGKGKPVAGIKIIAVQVNPIKGHERVEAVTKSDGTFLLKGLYPSSPYIIKVESWTDKWTAEVLDLKIQSAPQGETSVLPSALRISEAYSRDSGSEMGDINSGKMRFNVNSDGYISDSETGLDWVVGPKNINYLQAEQWVSECEVGGGNWRMPKRDELKSLVQLRISLKNTKNIDDKRHIDPAFKTDVSSVWAEPKDSEKAWQFSFEVFSDLYDRKSNSFSGYQVFGVR